MKLRRTHAAFSLKSLVVGFIFFIMIISEERDKSQFKYSSKNRLLSILRSVILTLEQSVIEMIFNCNEEMFW
jgi:hypothetical protein